MRWPRGHARRGSRHCCTIVLHELLQVDSPDIWQSLLAFNVGVEIGQLLLIVIAWPLFLLIARANDRVWKISR